MNKPKDINKKDWEIMLYYTQLFTILVIGLFSGWAVLGLVLTKVGI